MSDTEIDTESLKKRYETVKYTGRVYRLTHPDRLAMIARLVGVRAPPVEAARVLELGCGTGANTVSMAHHLPGSQFVGVDLSDTILEEGRTCVRDLGLTNVELIAASIESLPELGEFDYIISHGVYSWITDEARDALIGTLGRLLSPRGVGYISYNTLPGWYYRLQARDIMRWHGSRFEEPADQVQQGRLMLDFIVKGIDTEVSLYGRMMKRTSQNIDDSTPEYLFHDYHAPINRPIYVTDFLEHAAKHKLKFLGEAAWGDTHAARVPEAFHHALRELEDEPERFQQLIDHIRCTGFRRTLLVRESVELDRNVSPLDALDGVTVLMQGKLTDVVDYSSKTICKILTRDEVEVTTHDPLVKAALVELYECYPMAPTVQELYLAAKRRLRDHRKRTSTTLEAFGAIMIEFFSLDVVDLLPRRVAVSRELGERPRVNRLALWEARNGFDMVSNAYNERVESKNFERVLVRNCDGTKTLDELAQSIAEAIISGELVLHIDDMITTDPEMVLDVARQVTAEKVRLLPAVGLLAAP